jgi:glutathionylspermidine synthase
VRRLYGKARLGWEAEIETQGLVYNKTAVPGGDIRSYWREDVFYDFTPAEIDRLADATDQLFAACVEAGEVALTDDRLLDRMHIPRAARDVIRATWEDEPPSVYGRFDVHWDGTGWPRLLEFNADTPTSLVEAAVVQWSWHLETGQGRDQWNQLDDRLIAAWQRNLSRWASEHGHRPRVHLAWTEGDASGEDWMTVAYMADCVTRAGYEAVVITTEQIGLDTGDARFYDPQGHRIEVVFKLYPWEWLLDDPYGPSVLADLRRPGGTTWVEPIWKMLWSNKGLLALLWQRYSADPVISRLLLPAYFADDPRAAELTATGFARKPLLGREGNNVELVAPGGQEVLAGRGGRYGAEGWVVQQLCPLPDFPGPDGPHHPVLGTWVVDGDAAGLGIRESDGLITDDLSFFVPHTIDFRRPADPTWSA